MPLVQIEMFEGRTVDQKRQMVSKVADALAETLNCSRDKVIIVIREMKKENLAEGGILLVDKE